MIFNENCSGKIDEISSIHSDYIQKSYYKKKKVNKKYWARPINSIQEKRDNHSKYYVNNAILVNSLLSNYYSTY